MDLADGLRFVRITCLGASGCGKTSLVNCFINSNCPYRCAPTGRAEVYHKKIEVRDEDQVGTVVRPVLVEVEDTVGSDRASEGDAGAESSGEGLGRHQRIKKGSRVRLLANRQRVLALFNHQDYQGRLQYRPQMDAMLGQDFTVRAVGKDIVELPSPDGDGSWEFPLAAVELKLCMALPIDKFLNMGEKQDKTFTTAQQAREHRAKLTRPFSAYERPIGNAAGSDKTLTKNRMGYFICFDVSEESAESLKEAVTVYRMLSNSLEKRLNPKLSPIIWLVGCKADKTAVHSVVRQNLEMAQAFSETVQVPLRLTSARRHQGVQQLFYGMVCAIEYRMNLWCLSGQDAEESGRDGEAGGTCLSQ